MPTTELDADQLSAAAAALPPDRPVVMLNLLRFHEHARYVEDRFPPCSGQEAYFERYVPAFARIAPEFGGAEPAYVGAAGRLLVGPPEEWDMVALVEYPSPAAMVALLRSPAYLSDAAPHRVAALADWRFLVTTRLPG